MSFFFNDIIFSHLLQSHEQMSTFEIKNNLFVCGWVGESAFCFSRRARLKEELEEIEEVEEVEDVEEVDEVYEG